VRIIKCQMPRCPDSIIAWAKGPINQPKLVTLESSNPPRSFRYPFARLHCPCSCYCSVSWLKISDKATS